MKYSEEYVYKLNLCVSDYLKENEKVIFIGDTVGGIANKVLYLKTNYNNEYIFKIYKKKRNLLLANTLIKHLQSQGFNIKDPINAYPLVFEDTDAYLYEYINNVKYELSNELKKYILVILHSIPECPIENINIDDFLYSKKCDFEYEFLKKLKNYRLNSDIIKEVIKEYELLRNFEIVNSKEVVYSDLSFSNMLVTPDNKVFLIDFDETRITSCLYDLMVVIFKFFFDGYNCDSLQIIDFVKKYKEYFPSFSVFDYKIMFRYYICKQLLEKFYDYESYSVDIFSKQQMQDNFMNWIHYFENKEEYLHLFDTINDNVV